MNIKRQQSAGKKQSGMTLVEIMIALALLSVGMLALFGIFASAMQYIPAFAACWNAFKSRRGSN